MKDRLSAMYKGELARNINVRMEQRVQEKIAERVQEKVREQVRFVATVSAPFINLTFTSYSF